MKTQPQERYGFGTKLSTTSDRALWAVLTVVMFIMSATITYGYFLLW